MVAPDFLCVLIVRNLMKFENERIIWYYKMWADIEFLS